MIIVLFGPSGCGKTHIKNYFIKNGWNNIKSITTRPRRRQKEDEYFFVSFEEWNRLQKTKEFINVNNYHGNYYGIFLEDFKNASKNSVMISDVSSLDEIKIQAKKYNKNLLFAYCQPPKIEEIKKRHIFRGTEERIKISLKEIEMFNNQDIYYDIKIKNLNDVNQFLKKEKK